MSRAQSPLVGYNTNVRHKGKLYHIQTEDSGINHPHVITHLFADGGRIIASRKTSYSEHLGTDDIEGTVRKLMQEQHKAIFIELRDCVYDEDDDAELAAPAGASPAEAVAAPVSAPPAAGFDGLDVDALERAAEQRASESAAGRALAGQQRRGSGRYQQTVAARESNPPLRARTQTPQSIFGGQLLRGKSLDEVILSYLADDVSEPGSEPGR